MSALVNGEHAPRTPTSSPVVAVTNGAYVSVDVSEKSTVVIFVCTLGDPEAARIELNEREYMLASLGGHTNGRHHLLQLGRVPGHEHDVEASLGELNRKLASDSVGGTGDD